MENKENTRPYGAHNGSANDDDDSDSNDGPILYRDDPVGGGDRAAKIARKESLSLKLSLRPDRQELINRNILRIQTDNDQQETKEAIGARLIRRLSMRPTAEELVERNILKSKFSAVLIELTRTRMCIEIELTLSFPFSSPNARRAKEIERGEEKLFVAKIEFSSDS